MPMLALGRNPRLLASAFSCGEQRANNEKQAEKGCRVAAGTVTALNAMRVPISPRMGYI